MNKEVKELIEQVKRRNTYLEPPYMTLKTEEINLLIDYINQLETNIEDAIGYIKYCQTSDDDIFPVIEAEKMVELLERGKEC